MPTFPRQGRDLLDPVEEHPLIPAATVVLLRDGATGLEALMVRRSAKLAFAGGMWVFPGGRIDPEDYPDATVTDEPTALIAAARRAAVREAHEESALEVDEDELVWFSHWTPPSVTPKRFATWFFAAAAPNGVVTTDGGEILAHEWMTPFDALRRRNALEIELAPPTWITLTTLARFGSVGETLTTLAALPPEYFATRFAIVGTDVVAMYHGDAGYEASDPALDGGRHRLTMAQTGWHYERDDHTDPNAPAPITP